MIKQLASYQFVFLFCPGYIVSLVVFGSDFNSVSGWLYIFALTLIFSLHLSQRHWLPLLSQPLIRIIFGLAVVVGIFAYRQIHFQVWDEHSLSQAIYFSVFAVFAYICSVVATYADADDAVSANPGDSVGAADRFQLAKVLSVFALLWLPGLAYPHSILFAVVIILGLALVWMSWSNFNELCDKVELNVLASVSWRYYVFILSFNVSFIIWDFKVNSSWAAYIALTLFASAMGAAMSVFISNRIQFLVLGILVLNFIAAVVSGVFLLSGVHSVVLGVGLGLGLAWRLQTLNKMECGQFIIRIWPYVFLGFMVSYALYAHLSVSVWRFLFILPIIYFLAKDYRKRTT